MGPCMSDQARNFRLLVNPCALTSTRYIVRWGQGWCGMWWKSSLPLCTWRRRGGVTAKVVKMTYSLTEHYMDDVILPMDDIILL